MQFKYSASFKQLLCNYFSEVRCPEVAKPDSKLCTLVLLAYTCLIFIAIFWRMCFYMQIRNTGPIHFFWNWDLETHALSGVSN